MSDKHAPAPPSTPPPLDPDHPVMQELRRSDWEEARLRGAFSGLHAVEADTLASLAKRPGSLLAQLRERELAWVRSFDLPVRVEPVETPATVPAADVAKAFGRLINAATLHALRALQGAVRIEFSTQPLRAGTSSGSSEESTRFSGEGGIEGDLLFERGADAPPTGCYVTCPLADKAVWEGMIVVLDYGNEIVIEVGAFEESLASRDFHDDEVYAVKPGMEPNVFIIDPAAPGVNALLSGPGDTPSGE